MRSGWIGLAALVLGLISPAAVSAPESRVIPAVNAAPVSDDLSEAARLSALGAQQVQRGQFAQADPVLARALALYEASLAPDDPAVGAALSNLARVRKELAQYAEAESLYRRSLAILEKATPRDLSRVASVKLNLAALYEQTGAYVQAEALLRDAIAQAEPVGGENLQLALLLSRLGSVLDRQARLDDVESLYQRALQIRRRLLAPDHPVVADSLNNLGMFYYARGQYHRAESHYRNALDIRERALGSDHPTVAANLFNLGALYYTQGQFARAGQYYERALAAREKTYGPAHPAVAAALNALGGVYRRQGRLADAEMAYGRALRINEERLGSLHPDVASVLNNLGQLAIARGDAIAAQSYASRALDIRERALGSDHPGVSPVLVTLATSYLAQDKPDLAVPIFQRALDLRRARLPDDHPSIAISQNAMARALNAQGMYAQALSHARDASAIFGRRVVARQGDDDGLRESGRNRTGFAMHLALLERNPASESDDALADEALQVAQLLQISGTEAAVANMAARFAAGDDALADLVRHREDAARQLGRIESQLESLSVRAGDAPVDAQTETLKSAMHQAREKIVAIDAQIDADFPRYRELTRPQPLRIAGIQALLHQGEAMLVYASTDKTYLWVITPATARFIPLQVSTRELADEVARIRKGMTFDDGGQPVVPDLKTMHRLYEQIFEPARPYLDGAGHILVVPSGPLQSIPPGLLVASPVAASAQPDYRQVDWLIHHHAFSVLPAVSALRALRQLVHRDAAPDPFAGFGDPLIGEGAAATRGTRASPDIATTFRSARAGNDALVADASIVGVSVADVEAIRDAPRLKETADELRAMANVLRAGQDSLWLQDRATETIAKQTDLSRYRTLAFATHGVMAGEIDGVGEPGLIMTPPEVGSVDDDGYLSASEVARLKLNADWVILSACNTAASDGSSGAEGLSGLAKAFFHAGATSVLVSHWPVASEATVPLTTGMLAAYSREPGAGKAQAQRDAMRSLMRTPDHPEYAHPVFWAPFILVGEGN